MHFRSASLIAARRLRRYPRTLVAVENKAPNWFGPMRPEDLIPGIAISEGALEVSNVDVGDQLISRPANARRGTLRLKWRGGRSIGWRAELKTDRYFHGVYYPNAFSDRRPQIHPWPGGAGRDGRGRGFLRTTPSSSVDPSRDFANASSRPSAAFCAPPHIVACRERSSGRHIAAIVGNAAAGLALCGRDRAARRAPHGGNNIQGIGDRYRRHRSFPHCGWQPLDVGWPGNHLGRTGRSVFAPAIAPQDPNDFFPSSGRPEIAEVWGGAAGTHRARHARRSASCAGDCG